MEPAILFKRGSHENTFTVPLRDTLYVHCTIYCGFLTIYVLLDFKFIEMFYASLKNFMRHTTSVNFLNNAGGIRSDCLCPMINFKTFET